MWVVLIHLSCVGMLGVCGAISRAFANTQGDADRLSIGAWAWPYGRGAELRLSSDGAFSNTIFVFPLLGVLPMLAMSLMVWAFLRILQGGTGDRARAAWRAGALGLPWCAAWTLVWFAGFVTTALLLGPDGRSALGAGGLLTAIMGVYAIALVWWWRRFVVDHARLQRGAWVLMPMGFVALVVTALIGAGIKIAIGAA